jgi:hypothetical protein
MSSIQTPMFDWRVAIVACREAAIAASSAAALSAAARTEAICERAAATRAL